MIHRRLLFTVTASLACALLAGAQEVTAPTTPSGEAAPPNTPVSTPRLRPPGTTGGNLPTTSEVKPGAAETPLMPDEAPSLVKPDAGPGEAGRKKEKSRTSKTEAFAQDVQQKIRFRQVHTQALADRAVQVEWERSLIVRTDAEKRTVLKQYYKLLFARMEKIDRSLKTQIEQKATEAEHRLTQVRISPTEVSDESERSTAGRVFAE